MSFNLKGAQDGPYFKTLGYGDPDLVAGAKTAYPNGFTRRMKLNSTDDTVVDIYSLDSTGRMLIGAAHLVPFRNERSFYLQPNALQGTIPFFIADDYYYLTGVTARFHAAATTAGAVTGQIVIDRGIGLAGTSSNQGGPIISNTFNLKGTIDTNQAGTMIAGHIRSDIASQRSSPVTSAPSGIVLVPGDRLTFVPSTATLTSLTGLIVGLKFAPSGITTTYPYFQNLASLVVTNPFAAISRPGLTVTKIQYYYSVKASGACTLDVTQDSDGTASGGGTSLLTTTLDMTQTAGVTYTAVLTATAANLILGGGNRLSVKLATGATTALAGLVIEVITTPSQFQEITFNQANNTNLGTNQSWAGPFFRDYELVDTFASIETAAGAAYKVAVTIDLNGVAPGAGNVVQTDNTNAGFDLNGTPATTQWATLARRSLRIAPAGSCLGLKFSGTKTSTAGLVVGAVLRPI